jgi:cystathionine beta-lyase/cystathionine gamma-synthase
VERTIMGSVKKVTYRRRNSKLSAAELAQAGITPGLVRISVGAEHWRDLLADFEGALGG